MILYRLININEQTTSDFFKIQLPELESDEILTKQSDVYLLGHIIYYMLVEEETGHKCRPKIINGVINIDLSVFPSTQDKEIIESCIENKPEKRATINELIEIFFNNNTYEIIDQHLILCFEKNSLIDNNNSYFNILGIIYYEGEYISRDMNKSIHYFTLSANRENREGQFMLG